MAGIPHKRLDNSMIYLKGLVFYYYDINKSLFIYVN